MKRTILFLVVVIIVIIDLVLIFNGYDRTAANRPSVSQIPSPQANSGNNSDTAYTLADVQKHADASSCWSIIAGKVYDLTDWVNQHPGGTSHITLICGQDGTSIFDAQHSGQKRAQSELVPFLIGRLSQ